MLTLLYCHCPIVIVIVVTSCCHCQSCRCSLILVLSLWHCPFLYCHGCHCHGCYCHFYIAISASVCQWEIWICQFLVWCKYHHDKSCIPRDNNQQTQYIGVTGWCGWTPPLPPFLSHFLTLSPLNLSTAWAHWHARAHSYEAFSQAVDVLFIICHPVCNYFKPPNDPSYSGHVYYTI